MLGLVTFINQGNQFQSFLLTLCPVRNLFFVSWKNSTFINSQHHLCKKDFPRRSLRGHSIMTNRWGNMNYASDVCGICGIYGHEMCQFSMMPTKEQKATSRKQCHGQMDTIQSVTLKIRPWILIIWVYKLSGMWMFAGTWWYFYVRYPFLSCLLDNWVDSNSVCELVVLVCLSKLFILTFIEMSKSVK